MLIKIVLFINLIAYAVIVSQSFMYILALKNTQLALRAPSYIEVRHLIDVNMRSRFKYVLYLALLTSLALVILQLKDPASIGLITAAIAFVVLVIDIVLTVKGNLPVNDIINGWTAENYPANWQEMRQKWFTIFQYRQIANITGFISLLAGIVF